MLCKRCMTVMATGTTYEQRRDGKSSARRFHECKRCHDKVYTKEPNLFPSPSGVLIFLISSILLIVSGVSMFPSPSGVLIFLILKKLHCYIGLDGFRPLPGFLYS